MATLAIFALEQSSTAQALHPKHATDEHQAALGQFMTPEPIADFMADRFSSLDVANVRLLDAGAGKGALSLAVAREWATYATSSRRLSIDAFERDPRMVEALRNNLGPLGQGGRVAVEVIPGDFIALAAERIRLGEMPYTHAILNPPYKKIGSESPERLALASVGVETVNLYSGFVALSIKLLKPGGELVAIIPRSFCNGPYYKPFRKLLLANAAISSIHLFSARDKAFAGDEVLQENVILHLRKGVPQGDVEISTSTDASFSDLSRKTVPFEQIVFLGDGEQFIHIPVVRNGNALIGLKAYRSTLIENDLSVSTGPVVDFRFKRHLRAIPASGDVPLLYPGHFSGGKLVWPRTDFKKSNAIALNGETARWLYPRGFYVVVRRFSSKEERRRIVANLVEPSHLPQTPVGFENHLNVFHRNRGALPEDVARGLTIFLNAKVVDDWFRQFNGHTQVNATDLRSLPYPDLARLIELGRWSKANPNASPQDIDMKVERLR
jgi:adenine-specific DNA-methyltransferase